MRVYTHQYFSSIIFFLLPLAAEVSLEFARKQTSQLKDLEESVSVKKKKLTEEIEERRKSLLALLTDHDVMSHHALIEKFFKNARLEETSSGDKKERATALVQQSSQWRDELVAISSMCSKLTSNQALLDDFRQKRENANEEHKQRSVALSHEIRAKAPLPSIIDGVISDEQGVCVCIGERLLCLCVCVFVCSCECTCV